MKNLIFAIIIVLSFNQVHSQNYDFGKVSEAELQEKYHPKDSSASAAILYREEKIQFNYSKESGFTQERQVHERIKIYNKEGYDWATKKYCYIKVVLEKMRN
jgi:hypothetical protein